ncbi:unnamed protein product [Penicillium nalgiovense]|nr:unnamed protein product [Penicillium nalgiovense]
MLVWVGWFGFNRQTITYALNGIEDAKLLRRSQSGYTPVEHFPRARVSYASYSNIHCKLQ